MGHSWDICLDSIASAIVHDNKNSSSLSEVSMFTEAIIDKFDTVLKAFQRDCDDVVTLKKLLCKQYLFLAAGLGIYFFTLQKWQWSQTWYLIQDKRD